MPLSSLGAEVVFGTVATVTLGASVVAGAAVTAMRMIRPSAFSSISLIETRLMVEVGAAVVAKAVEVVVSAIASVAGTSAASPPEPQAAKSSPKQARCRNEDFTTFLSAANVHVQAGIANVTSNQTGSSSSSGATDRSAINPPTAEASMTTPALMFVALAPTSSATSPPSAAEAAMVE